MHVYHIIYCNKTNRYVYVPLCVVLCSCPHCKAFLSFERHYTNQMYYYYIIIVIIIIIVSQVPRQAHRCSPGIQAGDGEGEACGGWWMYPRL